MESMGIPEQYGVIFGMGVIFDTESVRRELGERGLSKVNI